MSDAWNKTYHWRQKGCDRWAKEWFKSQLEGLKVEDSGDVITFTELSECDGDVTLGSRKGKLITIYDLKIVAKWEGTAKDGSTASGKVHVPEVSHEAIDGLSDYVFEITGSPESSPLVSTAKRVLPPRLTEIFNAFPKALVADQGKEFNASPSASGASTPATPAAAPTPGGVATKAADAAKGAAPKAEDLERKVAAAASASSSSSNTSKVTVEGQFMASADDLWELLTDEKKVPMWSRAPAQIKPEPGSQFTLFGGGVKGEIVEAQRSKKLVQKWALSGGNWPEGHYATLTSTFEQGADSTTLRLTLEGVPKGQEDEIQRNLDMYYIRQLKQFGLGTIL